MLLMKNEMISSLVVSCLVTFLVWINMPADIAKNGENRISKTLFKSFVISLLISYIIFYFLGSGNDNTVYDNIIKGEPDF